MTSFLAFTKNDFHKAKRSEKGPPGCVAVARRGNWVEVRDTKTQFEGPNDLRLLFTAEQFDAYQNGIRNGHSIGHDFNVLRRPDGNYVFRNLAPQQGMSPAIELVFNQIELDAFHDGIMKHEFDLPTVVAA